MILIAVFIEFVDLENFKEIKSINNRLRFESELDSRTESKGQL